MMGKYNEMWEKQADLIEELTEIGEMGKTGVRLYCPEGNAEIIYRLHNEPRFTRNSKSFSRRIRYDGFAAQEARNSFSGGFGPSP